MQTDKSSNSDHAYVLVVDDNQIDRSIAAEALTNAGFEVAEAEDGRRALEMFRQRVPDIILLDVLMPEPDGFAVCQYVRCAPQGEYTPIILMTNLHDVESINKAYDLGASDFIVKPIRAALLPHQVRYALRAARTAQRLREVELQQRRAQATAKLGYWRWDAAQDALEWSAEVSRMFGLEPQPRRAAMADFLHRVHTDDRSRVKQLMTQVRDGGAGRRYQLDHRLMLPSAAVANPTQSFVHHEGEWNGRELSGILQDVTELRQTDQHVHQLAYYDSITGLPNRAHLRDHLKETLARARRYENSVALLFLDLDRFKEVNDSFGHSAGDQLLTQVATRLQECVRSHDSVVRAADPEDIALSSDQAPFARRQAGDKNKDDSVVRLGGDEFVIVADEIKLLSDAAHLCERIVTMFNTPFQLDGHAIEITTSIGVSLFPDHGADLETLLKCADRAMYQAKQNGRNGYQLYNNLDDQTVLSVDNEKSAGR